MKNNEEQLINKTKADYNRIAALFSSKRELISSDLLKLKADIEKSNHILDFGCGNGRMSELIENQSYIGVDNSSEMIAIAKKRYPQKKFTLIKDEWLFSDDKFDLILCLSVVHHIPKKFRAKLFKKFYHSLQQNGKLILSVWYFYTNKKYLNEIILNLFKKRNYRFNELLIPFKNEKGEKIIDRYICALTAYSLKKELKKIGFRILDSQIVQRGKGSNYNLVIKAQK
jgi:cyclopropane fatty-acyl-phospholipid synthase-like methyltransferase